MQTTIVVSEFFPDSQGTCDSNISSLNVTSMVPSRLINSQKRWWPMHLGGALVETARYEVVGVQYCRLRRMFGDSRLHILPIQIYKIVFSNLITLMFYSLLAHRWKSASGLCVFWKLGIHLLGMVSTVFAPLCCNKNGWRRVRGVLPLFKSIWAVCPISVHQRMYCSL